jgi:hypothetical protein
MTFEVGERVKDKESESSEAVVVRQTDATAMEFSVPSTDETVASLNKNYNPMSKVTEVSFVDELERKVPQWAFMSSEDFKDIVSSQQIKTYYYPCERLEKVSSGLVNGLVVRVSGVSEPIEQDVGAYAVQVKSDDVLYENSEVVKVSDYPVNNINENTARYIGLEEGIRWASDNRDDFGILIRVSNSDLANQLDNSYEVKNKGNKIIYDSTQETLSGIPYVGVQEVTRKDVSSLKVIAKDTFNDHRGNNKSNSEVSVEKIIDNEYLVDGSYNVDISHETCTCGKTGECEHIELAKNC